MGGSFVRGATFAEILEIRVRKHQNVQKSIRIFDRSVAWPSPRCKFRYGFFWTQSVCKVHTQPHVGKSALKTQVWCAECHVNVYDSPANPVIGHFIPVRSTTLPQWIANYCIIPELLRVRLLVSLSRSTLLSQNQPNSQISLILRMRHRNVTKFLLWIFSASESVDVQSKHVSRLLLYPGNATISTFIFQKSEISKHDYC